MSPLLDKLSREFRSAVLGGEHVLAERLVCEYTDALRQLWESLPESDRATSLVPQQARELLAWARGMVVVERAMAAEQLVIVQKARRYKLPRDPEANLARTF